MGGGCYLLHYGFLGKTYPADFKIYFRLWLDSSCNRDNMASLRDNDPDRLKCYEYGLQLQGFYDLAGFLYKPEDQINSILHNLYFDLLDFDGSVFKYPEKFDNFINTVSKEEQLNVYNSLVEEEVTKCEKRAFVDTYSRLKKDIEYFQNSRLNLHFP